MEARLHEDVRQDGELGRQGGAMCCLLTTLVLIGPRAAIIIWWLMQPVRWQAAFDTFIIPAFGFIFLPWLTLMYVGVAPGGIIGLDWMWLALALVVDIASYGGGYYGRRRGPG